MVGGPFDAFMSADDIYRNFTEGPGGGDLSTGADMVKQLATEQQSDADAIRSLAVRMEAAWEGDASGAAHRGAVPLAAEHAHSSAALHNAQDLVSRQVGSFDSAKNTVVKPPPEPQLNGWGIDVATGTPSPTYHDQLTNYNAASAHNVDVMNSYQGASDYNTVNLPSSYGTIQTDSAGVSLPSGGAIGNGIPADTEHDGGMSGGSGNGARPPDGAMSGGSGTGATDGAGGPATGGQVKPPTGSGSVAGPGTQSTQSTVPGGYQAPRTSAGVDRPALPVAPPGGSTGDAVSPIAEFPGGGVPGRGGAAGFGTGNGIGGPGSPETRGERPGGRGAGVGNGARTAVGPLASGAATVEETAAGRAARGRGGVPVGGMAPGHGGGDRDEERERPSFLVEDDPEGLFGTDEVTAPPVIE